MLAPEQFESLGDLATLEPLPKQAWIRLNEVVCLVVAGRATVRFVIDRLAPV